MSIWFKDYRIEDIKSPNEINMISHLGIEYTELGEDYLRGTMPVDERTRQPFGVLHGGASVVLAESLGSSASNLTLDPEKEYSVGLDINANHVRPVSSGKVTGTARMLHKGRTTQVWEIHIENEEGKPVCISRLTMAVVSRKER